MNILQAEQIKEWDAITISKQGITSAELMERAATACCAYLLDTNPNGYYLIFCGPGNNGGDGLALARLLHQAKQKVELIGVWEEGASFTDDHAWNQAQLPSSIPFTSFPVFQKTDRSFANVQIIDAILGMGQNRPVAGIFKQAVEWINRSGAEVISIDIPTGLYETCHNTEDEVVEAKLTLSFGAPKLPFFFPENERYIGKWEILTIGLDGSYQATTNSQFHYVTQEEIDQAALVRRKFSHKGSFGTAYLFAGQLGMTGAAILASKACLRAGVGKLIVRTPKDCLSILQSSVPEVICDPDPNEDVLTTFPTDLTQYQSVGIGPGIGKSPLTKALIWKLLRNGVPNLVLDADALNIIAEEGWQNQIPPGTVITPHIKELERLWGPSENHFQRLMMCRVKAIEQRIVVVVKGAHTAIVCPDGHIYFNTTGNAGLAKAGTGDILTGMVTGILAQGYALSEGVKRAVFLHGLAADRLSQERDLESFLATDLVNCIGLRKI